MRLGNWLRTAFAVEDDTALQPTPDEARLVDRLCRAIVVRGLRTPAVVALDCSHNLNFLASQTMVFLEPIVTLLFKGDEYARFRGFLARRGSIEYICRRIESFADQPDAPVGDSPQHQTKDQLDG